jgi:hypothetical protein
MSSMKPTRRERAALLVEAARGRLMAPETDDRMREVGMRVLGSAERAMARLESAAGTLESAARLEMQLLSRLVPIVDDLGELVRHTLEEARERRGLAARRERGERPSDDIIDVDAD